MRPSPQPTPRLGFTNLQYTKLKKKGAIIVIHRRRMVPHAKLFVGPKGKLGKFYRLFGIGIVFRLNFDNRENKFLIYGSVFN